MAVAKDFIRALLQVDPHKRLSADEALRHPVRPPRNARAGMSGSLTGFSQWLTTEGAADVDLSSNLKENFNARRKWERAFLVCHLPLATYTPYREGIVVWTSVGILAPC